MADVKDKMITVESLSILHNHNKNTYMPIVNPAGSGTMTIDSVDTNFIMLGTNAKLALTDKGLEVVFL